ncbi:MAG TPA: DUF192 domain-containing protein [Rhodopila sp.]|jgi:uncharacterized membrane protein (UPF0127 family)|nr:DUF192 domain-containing protein [Rhodopila sp.]
MKRRLVLTLAASLLTVGAYAQSSDPKGPQPELPKEKLVIVSHDGKEHVFNVEMATTTDQQTVGEMFRKSIPEDGGMLFDWGRPQPTEMWMKNTLVPLDMIFINNNGTIRSIAENTVPHSLAVIDAGGPVRATLEVNAGTTAKLGIQVGDTVKQRIFGNAP